MGERGSHVIRKGGLFYRPKACGYTSDILEAGRWSEADARHHINPDAGVTIHLFSDYWPPVDKTQTSELIQELTRENEQLRQQLSEAMKLLDKTMKDWAESNRGISEALNG